MVKRDLTFEEMKKPGRVLIDRRRLKRRVFLWRLAAFVALSFRLLMVDLLSLFGRALCPAS